MVRAMVARQLQVFTALRNRGFRLYWTGFQFHIMGYALTFFTIGWLAFHLTGSPLDLSFVTLALAVPSIGLNVVGGAVADRLNPKHVLTVVQSIASSVVAALAFLTLTEQVELWHLVVGSILLGIFLAFDHPSRTALYPRLLSDRQELAKAVPLISMAWDLNRIIWPAAAGFIIHALGAEASFFLGAVGFVVMASVVQLLRPRHVPRSNTNNMIGSMAEGFRYIWSHPLFRVLVSTGYVNNFLGMSYVFLLPIFAKDVLQVDARGLGILASAAPIGGIMAVLIMPNILRRYRGRDIVTLGTLAFAGSLVAFSASPWFFLSLFLMVIIGFTTLTFTVAIVVTLQTLVPDELRGRVMGLYGNIHSLPPLGAAIVAAVASFTGVQWAFGGAVLFLIANILIVNVFNVAFRNLGIVGASSPQAATINKPIAQ